MIEFKWVLIICPIAVFVLDLVLGSSWAFPKSPPVIKPEDINRLSE